MPTSTIGPLTLPIAAGTAGQKLDDPAATALLDYLGFWLKNSLDARLANLTGTSADACPTANRFTFDPTDQRGHRVRLPVPALYVWWSGQSKLDPQTLVYDVRTRTLSALYVFDELPAFAEMDRRSGLLAAADAAFAKAASRQAHPSYSYNSRPLGEALVQAAAPAGTFGFTYNGGTAGHFGLEGGEKAGRSYPALTGTFTVWERVAADDQSEASIKDLIVDLETNEAGDLSDTIAERTRYLAPGDGLPPDEDS